MYDLQWGSVLAGDSNFGPLERDVTEKLASGVPGQNTSWQCEHQIHQLINEFSGANTLQFLFYYPLQGCFTSLGWPEETTALSAMRSARATYEDARL